MNERKIYKENSLLKNMKPDLKRIKYSIKGEHLNRPLIKYFYAPLARLFLYIICLLNLNIQFVNTFNLLFSVIAALIIFFYPRFLWLAGIMILVAFVMDLCDGAWARYNKRRSLYGKWLDETNGLLGIFLIFVAGAWLTYYNKGEIKIFILVLIAVFGYLMMNYAGILMELIEYRYQLKEKISDVFRKSLSKKIKIKKGISNLGFSFEYQWTLIAILTALNQFELMFWIFGILGNLQWMARYVLLWPRR